VTDGRTDRHTTTANTALASRREVKTDSDASVLITLQTAIVANPGWNRNKRWDCERNGHKSSLSLAAGMEMGMNSWQRKGMRLKKPFSLISTAKDSK